MTATDFPYLYNDEQDDDMDITIDAASVTDSLQGLLDGDLEAADFFPDVRTRTFRDAGVLTSNDGLVVTLSDGSEFQVTVVRSR